MNDENVFMEGPNTFLFSENDLRLSSQSSAAFSLSLALTF